jgi:hypothetical protein
MRKAAGFIRSWNCTVAKLSKDFVNGRSDLSVRRNAALCHRQIFWVGFDPIKTSTNLKGGDACGPTSGKGIADHFPRPCHRIDEPAHDLYGFLRRMLFHVFVVEIGLGDGGDVTIEVVKFIPPVAI